MKKSKKLGLQSLALVLMSLVLVAGVAFGMTGAWFQDQDAVAGSSVQMGHSVTLSLKNDAGTAYVGISKTSGDGTLEAAMPGDVYEFDGLQVVIPAKQSAMYVIIKVDNTAGLVFENDLAVNNAAGWTAFTSKDMGDYLFKAVDASDAEQVLEIYAAGPLVVARSLDNKYADRKVEISGAAYAIQQANILSGSLAGKQFKDLTNAEINALFAETVVEVEGDTAINLPATPVEEEAGE